MKNYLGLLVFPSLIGLSLIPCGQVRGGVISSDWDLTTKNGTTFPSALIGDAIYSAMVAQPTGTGFINSFVRLEHDGNQGSEKAFNTTVSNTFNNKSAANFDRSIYLGDVPIVQIGGVEYREFLLDINEPAASNKALLSLDEIQIFVGGIANRGLSDLLSDSSIVDYFHPNGVLAYPADLVYRLDSGTADHRVLLNYDLNGGGSGKGDMALYVPDSRFTGRGANEVLTLYSQFGLTPHADSSAAAKGPRAAGPKASPSYVAEAGFEEWYVRDTKGLAPGGPVSGGSAPEPGALAIFGLLALSCARVRARRASSTLL